MSNNQRPTPSSQRPTTSNPPPPTGGKDMNRNDTQKAIESGKAALGVEFGSTRIKAVLIGEDHAPIAAGSHEWENRYENGIWTYSLEDVWKGLQDSYRQLNNEVV